MSKMTDEDIKKALECCKGGFCCGCPGLSNNMVTVDCMRELINDTLDLINRTKGDAIHYRRKAQNQKQELSRLNAEIERLKVRLRKEQHQFADIGKMYSEIRAEANKECLDSIEAFLCGVCGNVVEDNPNLDRILFGYNTEEVDAFIDNLRKEMVGEQDNG